MDIDIQAALRRVGVAPSDWVMMHGDAGVAAQFRTIEATLRLRYLISQLVDFMEGGTLVVPSFSYSFTKGEDFDVTNTPSDVGQFSEEVRRFPGVRRTHHPIFSVATIGPGVDSVLNARLDDCFGPGTVFDLLYEKDAKVVCLGCDFGKVTFVHYIEQKVEVSYRSPKSFHGSVIANGQRTPLTTTYMVRSRSLQSVHDLRRLKCEAILQGVLKVDEIGRFPICAVSARKLFDVAHGLLKQDEYALIKQGATDRDV